MHSSHCYSIICLPPVYNKLKGCLLQYMGEPATCTQFILVYHAWMSCNVWMYSSYTPVARSQPPPVLQVHRNDATLHVYYMAGIVSIPRLSGFQWQAIDLCCCSLQCCQTIVLCFACGSEPAIRLANIIGKWQRNALIVSSWVSNWLIQFRVGY